LLFAKGIEEVVSGLFFFWNFGASKVTSGVVKPLLGHICSCQIRWASFDEHPRQVVWFSLVLADQMVTFGGTLLVECLHSFVLGRFRPRGGWRKEK
jgi:hypothetical protein